MSDASEDGALGVRAISSAKRRMSMRFVLLGQRSEMKEGRSLM
jgi:hypothetical protein